MNGWLPNPRFHQASSTPRNVCLPTAIQTEDECIDRSIRHVVSKWQTSSKSSWEAMLKYGPPIPPVSAATSRSCFAAMHAPGKTESKAGGKGSQVKEITEQEPAAMKKITAEDEDWSEKPADEGPSKGRLECQWFGGAAAEVGGRTSCVCSLEPKWLRIHRVSTHS